MSDWAIPALSCVTLLVWVAVLVRARPLIASRTPAPSDLDIVVLSTSVLLAASLLISSLRYAGVISAEAAVLAINTGRVALLVGGVTSLMTLRRSEP